MDKRLEKLKEYIPEQPLLSSYEIDAILSSIDEDLEVLEILKKKEVAIDELKNCIKHDSENRPALEEYNSFAGDKKSLTQEEFNKIKEWLENE